MSTPSETHKKKTPTGKLYAIADIHVAFAYNQEAWAGLSPHPGDGLILCGDIGETVEHLRLAFSTATRCFDTVWWCPGNHELYTLPTGSSADFRGEEKYQQCVEVARSYDVLTPEDDFVVWGGQGGPTVIAPIFTLYDYTFKPDDVAVESTFITHFQMHKYSKSQALCGLYKVDLTARPPRMRPYAFSSLRTCR